MKPLSILKKFTSEVILRVWWIKSNEPSAHFAESYSSQAVAFLEMIKKYRKKELQRAT